MNDIDRIKSLLFGHEKKALDAITRRLEIPESRTADIADVLPEAVLRSHASDPRLARALEAPVEQCIKNSIRKDPHDFADALFPVIGPAIRKAIAEALRSMTQSLNQAIENSLSVRTRFQAWRAGMPLGAYILQRNVIYRVEQAFLIKRSDGLLIEHVHHDGAISKDTDAVSAMFTAIQDFIQHSFEEEADENLTTAVLGELTLWAMHGPGAILVCVIRGVPPNALRNDLSSILERIHLNYGQALADYNGGSGVAGIDLELEKCLLLEHREVEQAEPRKPVAAIVLLLALAALLAWWFGSSIAERERLDRFRRALESTPGIVVTELRRVEGQVLVRGLRDPLSASPADLAPAAHLEPADLRLSLEPYQSLDGPIVERRARRVLRPPPGVGMRLDAGTLRLSGSAPAEWKQRAMSLSVALPGIDSIDISGMSRGDDEVLAAARAALKPPPTLELSASDAVVSGRGTAPAAWLQQARRTAPSVAEIRALDLSAAVPSEQAELERLVAEIDGTEIFFVRNDVLLRGQVAVIVDLANRLQRMAVVAGSLSLQPRVGLSGHVDGIGDTAQNRQVAEARTDRVARGLQAAGVPAQWIRQLPAALPDPDGAIDPARRKVVVRVNTVSATNEN